MIDMKTLTDQQKRQLSRLLEMLETEKDPAKPIRWDRKYDNYGKYIVTLGMFEFYCKKAEFLELGFENVEVEEIRDITKEKDKNVGPEDDPTEVHVILLSAEVIILEGIRLTDVLEGVYFLNAEPLNLADSDGSPCRAVLIENAGF